MFSSVKLFGRYLLLALFPFGPTKPHRIPKTLQKSEGELDLYSKVNKAICRAFAKADIFDCSSATKLSK